MKKLLSYLGVALTIFMPQKSFAVNEAEKFMAQRDPQVSALGDCYRANSVRYANLTCEPLSTVVEAALGACTAQETAYKKALIDWGGGSNFAETTDRILSKLKTDTRSYFLSIAAEARIKNGRCSKN